jgi:hypothetical protein
MFQALGAAVNALPGRDISTELAIQVGRTNVRKFKLYSQQRIYGTGTLVPLPRFHSGIIFVP